MTEQRILQAWHNAEVKERYRQLGLWGDRTVAEVFDEQASLRSDKLAVADQTVRWSYRQLQDLSLRLASVLLDLGVKEGDPVAAQLPSSAWLATVHLAANRVGALFMPLSTTWRRAEVASLVSVTQPPILIVPVDRQQHDFVSMGEQIRLDVPALRRVVPLDGGDSDSLQALMDQASPITAAEQRRRRPDPDGPAHVMCTSGTTGTPKASVWGGNDLITTLLGHFARVVQLSPDDTAAGLAPANTGSTGYIFPVLAPLLVGASAVLLEQWSPQAALELIVRERATYATAIPTQMVMMLDLALAQADLSCFSRFTNAGAPLAATTAQAIEDRMGCRVQTIYGATDGGIPAMTDIASSDEARLTSVGRLLPGEELRLVGPDGQDVPTGEVGELLWRGPNKSFGYLNQPDYDRAVWDQDGWFHSGDLGQIDAEGNLRIVGRTKDMILRGGTNIFPREIEELLLRHPAVARVTIVGVPDARLGEQACAVVVPGTGQTPTLPELTSFLLEQGISKVKLPEHLVLVDDLPTNAGGKIDKANIQKFVIDRLER